MDIFTSCYVFLANRMHERRENRFHLEPSLHLFKHMAYRLRLQLAKETCRYILSPAAYLAEAGEDFIGKVARLSRRVSARLTGQRTLERMLIKTFYGLERAELISLAPAARMMHPGFAWPLLQGCCAQTRDS